MARIQFIYRIEGALKRAILQAGKCDRALGLPGVAETISILQQAKITCVTAIAGANASIANNTAWTKMWRTMLDQPPFYQFLLIRDDISEWKDEDLAAAIFHEALHSTPSNNRLWHNRPFDHPLDQCGVEASGFVDRVFMTEAACFPRSSKGEEFYSNPTAGIHCPGVCEAALNSRDLGVEAQWKNEDGTENTQLLAKPLPAEQAKALCQKARTNRALF